MSIKIFFKKSYNAFVLFIETFVSLLSIIIFSSLKNTREITKLKKSVVNNEACLIGNGPSVKITLDNKFNYFKNKDVFVVNYFCNTSYFELLKPQYYVILDFDNFYISSKESYFSDSINSFIVNMMKVTWKMYLFVPISIKRSNLLKMLKNKNISIIFYNMTPVKGFKVFQRIAFRLNFGMPDAQTVIIASIFIAINNNYEKIHLFGVEHSWLKDLNVDDNNNVNIGLEHFYKTEGPGVLPENDLSNFLFRQAKTFNSHKILEEYSKYKGVEIINHTNNSFIDAYRKEIEYN